MARLIKQRTRVPLIFAGGAVTVATAVSWSPSSPGMVHGTTSHSLQIGDFRLEMSTTEALRIIAGLAGLIAEEIK